MLRETRRSRCTGVICSRPRVGCVETSAIHFGHARPSNGQDVASPATSKAFTSPESPLDAEQRTLPLPVVCDAHRMTRRERKKPE